jgi:hypothetical protein
VSFLHDANDLNYKHGLLQFYPPYKNLDLRFLGKKRGKGLHRSSTIVFLEVVDPRYHEASFSSFVLKERGTNPEKMDLLKDGVPQSQLMKECFINIF